ncbi:MAG TPA: YceI family protein [Acidimicrobiales bacterium]|nr:YceI family protein [Acidimicrobiales bacterium]
MTTEPRSGALPLARGTWTLDPNHSAVHFRVSHLGLSNVRGRFDRFDATLSADTILDEVAVSATVDLGSVDTNQPDRDADLRTTDFFSSDQHPEMTFRSPAVKERFDGEYELTGELTINGITEPLTSEVELTGAEVFPGDGKTPAGFSATGEVNRDDFGIDFNVPLGMDKMALGQRVRTELELQFVAPEA